MVNDDWLITEYDNERLWIKIRKKIAEKDTSFQKIQILDSFKNGKLLAVDGEVQSAQIDEYIYHEALVHPALIRHQNPRNALVLGAGEGASIRELLKHKSIECIVGIDIDEELIDLVKQHLPEWHQGAFEDKRFKLVITDALDYLGRHAGLYDVIISDLTDPGLNSPANQLYTKEFYDLVKVNLSGGGVMVIQSQAADPGSHWHHAVFNTLKSSFKNVLPYYIYLESFRSLWSFMLASDASFNKIDVDKVIDERGVEGLKFYDGTTHNWMFFSPPYVKQGFSKDIPVLTKSNVNEVVRRVIADDL